MSKLSDHRRFKLINKLLISYSLGNFSKRLSISDNMDEIDAFISSLNMLGEELEETTTSKNYTDTIFNSITDLLFVINKQGLILDCNLAVEKKLELHRSELLNINRIQHLLEKPSFNLKKHINETQVFNISSFETILQTNNSETHLHCILNPIFYLKSKSQHYLLIARDISKLKTTEISLKNYSENYQRIYDDSEDPIFFTDIHFRINASNKAGKKIFSMHSQMDFQKYFFDHIQADQFRKELLLYGFVREFKCKLIFKDQNRIADCLISVNKITDENNAIVGYHGLIKDITEKIITENLVIRAIVNTQEQERIRFGKDLHDGLGQKLSALKFFLGSLENELNKFTSKGSSLNQKNTPLLFKRANDLLLDSLEELRNVCFNLMPKTLEEFGLFSALKELCTTLSSDSKLEFDLKLPEKEVYLNKNLEFAIYRIIQEFINNSLKHGSASHILIQLILNSKNICILLRDNGLGFKYDKIKNHEGMGLKNVKSRVRSFNGGINIHSIPQKGTSYSIIFPVLT